MTGKRCLALSLSILLLFGAFHSGLYVLLTRRLSNNFSSVSKAGMIDVGSYLPHDPHSKLPEIETEFRLSENLPVLDGAAALVPVYASIIDTVYPKGCVKYEGGSFSDENYYGENFASDSAMQYKNTVRGYKAIVDGDTDLLFCAAPSKEQLAYAKEKGVELTFVPVGLEGFVFFVNKQNPVSDLTCDQIREIYEGNHTSWADFGGPRRTINPITRLEGSGSQSAFEAFMGDRTVGTKSPFAITGGAIGFSFRYYMDGIVENTNVKMLSLNGVYPSKENIQNGSYPIVAKFYAVYRTDNQNPSLPLLIDWILSDEGQDLIEANGYVRIQ